MSHRNSVMKLAILISVLFHLSMVTLFQIVILFPQNEIDYFLFQIIDPRTQQAQAAPDGKRLRMPSPDEAFERIAPATGNDTLRNAISPLPEIILPTLEFASLDRLRLKSEGLDIRAQYTELFQDKPQDTWTLFGRKLSSLGDVLSRIGGNDPSRQSTQPALVSRPAPGFEAYLIWMTEPKSRQPLTVATVDALWGVDPANLQQSITLVFKVDRQGKVTEIIVPNEDEFGFADSAAQALLKYRFQAVPEDGPDLQHGTLIIGAAGKRP